MEPRHNKRLTIPLLVTLLLLSLWVTGGVWLFSERQRVIEARETDLATLTIAVEEQTLRLFELTEISVQSIANWVEAHPKAHPAQTPSFNKLVSELRRVANGALDFRIIDAIDGKKAAAASQPMTKAANAVTNDRAICMQSGPPTRGLQIGDPVRSPVNNQWVVPVTLPLPRADGTLSIVCAILELDWVTQRFELQRVKPNGSITIIKDNGVTLFRSPTIEGSIGRSFAGSPEFTDHLNTPGRGQYRIKGAFDGVSRLISHAHLARYPLIIAVTASIDDALLAWRTELIKSIAFILFITVAAVLATRRYLYIDNESRTRLFKSERRFRSLLERAPDPTWIVDGSRIVECNDAAIEVLGYSSREDLLKLHPSKLSPPNQPDGENSRAKARRMTAIAKKQGLHRFEWILSKADASEFVAEMTFSVVDIEDRENIYCVCRDITERKRVESLAERERVRLRTILETASDGIHILDSEGVLVEANEAFLEMLGYDDTVIGKLHVTDWDVQDSWEVISGRIEDMIVQRKKMVFETRHHRRDGSVLDVEISASGIEIEGKGYLYAASRDISERKRTEADLRIAATTFDSQEGIFITDANAGILRTNRAFEEITGYSSEEAVGQNPRLLSSGRHPPAFYTAMWESIVSAGTWRGEIWNRRKNGESYPQYLSITAVKKEDGTVTHYVASFTDITERKVAADKIEHLAFYDSLTDLPNRRLMLDRLRQAVANSARHNRHGALMLIDLDNFKTLNDTLGHAIGDQLLKEVALRLKASIREGDTVARLGGDEFVVILEDLDESDAAPRQAESVAEKILARLRYPYQLDLARADGSPGSRSHHCTSSIGISLFRDHSIQGDDLMKRADLAMYQAKAAGRNTIRFFDPGMQAAVTERVVMEADLRKAIADQQFLLHYQVQIDVSGRAIGAEVLLRWQHPERGMVSPAEFIPLAEETELILPLGLWVLETACRQLSTWARTPGTAHLTLAVNVSARQFRQPDFADQILAVLNDSKADPAKLKLELTESLLLDDVDRIIAKMEILRAKGVGFSLDDFGTGYSSLAYLKRLPLSQLKIDQSFVRDVTTNPNAAAIARTVVALAQNLELGVIAEGVETEAQRDFLAQAGCFNYQGYFFGRPLPIEDFESLLKQV